MGLVDSGVEMHRVGNASHQMDQKHDCFTSPDGIYNTKWETAPIFMSVGEGAIIKSTVRVNTPLQFWGRTNSPGYHVDRFHTYKNKHKKYGPRCCGMGKSVNSRLSPMQFSDGREQGLPGQPSRMSKFRLQVSANPFSERGNIQIYITGTTYV